MFIIIENMCYKCFINFHRVVESKKKYFKDFNNSKQTLIGEVFRKIKNYWPLNVGQFPSTDSGDKYTRTLILIQN